MVGSAQISIPDFVEVDIVHFEILHLLNVILFKSIKIKWTMHTTLVVALVKDTLRLLFPIVFGIKKYILLIPAALVLVEVLKSLPVNFGSVFEKLF